MNITVPQNVQTKTELEELSDVKHVIISARTSNPIMGLKQDGVLGAFNMTKPSTKIDGRSIMNMLVNLLIPKENAIKYNKDYSGHELFSCIIPDRINKSNFGNSAEILVNSGKLISGYLKKSALGEEKPNNLIQLILDEYGVNEAKDFFDNAQKLIDEFNMYNGFSVGLIDTVLSVDIIRQIKTIKDKEMLKASVYVTEIENNPDMVEPIIFEDTIRANLDGVMNDASSLIMKNMTYDNSINVMATAGQKGNPSNTGQMVGLLGQPSLEGKRMPKKIGKRSLPYFFRNDDTAKGRGFIEHSFLTGLEYPEFVFHNMSAREGLIDTAIKTAETGYTQRKLIKQMEDILISYDRTLRTATGAIIQFIYGDSGQDTTKQYNYSIDMLMLDDKQLENRYKFTSDELNKLTNFTKQENESYCQMLKNLRVEMRKSQVKTKLDYRTFKSYIDFRLPVNLPRILDKIKQFESVKNSELDPKYILDKLNEVIQHQSTYLVCIQKNNTKAIKLVDEQIAKTSLMLALHNALSPKRCIFEYKLSRDAFDYAIQEIINGYRKNIAEPGEMVGIVAVQALIPPLTQLTLNTFHSSGIGSKGTTTLGVPRLKELISLTKTLKTPQMMIYMKKEFQQNKEMVHRISAYIKKTNLIDIRNKVEVYYDPNPKDENSFAKKDQIGETFYIHSDSSVGCQKNIESLPWLVRIELDREKLLNKDVSLLDIQSKFCSMWESRFSDLKKVSKEERTLLEKVTQCGIVSNFDNSDTPVVHIRFNLTEVDMDTINNFVDLIIDNLKMKGLDFIKDVYDPGEEAYISIDNEENAVKDMKEYVIVTSGVNMYDIRLINGIDISRTICNDVMQVYEIFGIEAARISLLREITTMLERAGTYVNYHHLSVLVDLMTRDGFMISIDRHGMGRTDAAPLGKVSFEKPVEQLLIAAVFNETDPLRGVSGRIMTGNVIKGGTGLCDLVLDADMIEKSEYIEQETDISIIDETDTMLIDDIINKDQSDIFVPTDE